MWHFYIHVAGQKKVVVVAAAFFLHLHSLHTLFAVGSAFGIALGHLGRWKLGNHLRLVGSSAVPSLSGCIICELQMGCRCVLCHL